MIHQIAFYAKEFFRRLEARHEEGQGLIEYALIILLVSIVVIVILTALGGQINTVFTSIRDTLSGAGVAD